MQQAVTDAELFDALAQRQRGLPPPPSQSFTVHDDHIYNSDPTRLYDKYGGGEGSSGCIYFFCDQFTYQDGWKVAAGTQPVLDGGGGAAVVGWKDTLVFHEGRWLPRTRCWAMDEFHASSRRGYNLSLAWLRLYRRPQALMDSLEELWRMCLRPPMHCSY